MAAGSAHLQAHIQDYLPIGQTECLHPEVHLSDEERQRTVLDLLPEVKAIANSMHRRLPSSVQLDDLQQAGCLGLLDAVAKYDPSRNLPLKQYAKIRITGAMFDSLRELDWASRYMRTRQQKLQHTARTLEARLGRQANSEEMAEELGLDLQGFYEFAAAVQDLQRVECEPDEGETKTTAYIETVPDDPDQVPEARYLQTELRGVIQKSLDCLNADQKHVIESYYFQEHTMAEIARDLHVTESRISQIHANALERLEQKLGTEIGRRKQAGRRRRTRNMRVQ